MRKGNAGSRSAIFGGPWSADRELALLRLANALLVLPLPLLAWWAARRFGLADDAAVTAALLLFCVAWPGLMYGLWVRAWRPRRRGAA